MLGEPHKLIPRCAVAQALHVDHHEPVLKGQRRLVVPSSHMVIIRDRDPAMFGHYRYPVLVEGPTRDEIRDEWVTYVGNVIAQLLHNLADSESALIDDKSQLTECHE